MWAGTEFDLNVFIDMIGLMAERAGMSALTPGPLGRPRALSGLNAERSSLAVRSALGGFEGLLECTSPEKTDTCFSVFFSV